MIPIKTAQQIKKMREASCIVADILYSCERFVKPCITTAQIEEHVKRLIEKAGAVSAFKGYHGYPGNICTSINNEVVHGIPGNRLLNEGDIVSIDVGVNLDGYFSDAAITVGVGNISDKAKQLIDVTRDSLEAAIDKVRPGNRLSDISFAVQSYCESRGYGVVRKFVGHGVGKALHEEPQIPNFGNPGTGPRLLPGMVLAIEPMINEGAYDVEILSDGWTAVTKDGALSAHFEHTVAVTEDSHEVLTRWQKKNN